MRGHISRKGNRWYPILEHGYQQALRCQGCDRRAGWADAKDAPKVCPRCGGSLTERSERRQRWHQGHARKRDAQAALVAALGSAAAGTYVEPSRLLLSEFVEQEWLPGIRSTVRPSTLAVYRSNLNRHVLPALGNVELRALQASALNALYSSLLESGHRDGGGLSPASVGLVHVICHRVLKDAVRWNRLARNVADNADPPRSTTPEMAVWDSTQLRQFLAHVKGDRLEGLWVLASTTGARRGELAGLRWTDVDLDSARISIRQTLAVTAGRPYISVPKTPRSRRSISLDPGTVLALRAHRRRQLEERLRAGVAWIDTGLCFIREDGSWLHPERQVSVAFARLVRAAGLPPISFHGLRHTFATVALAAGCHVKVVSERLGHSSVAVTLDRYSHVLQSVGEDEANRVGSIILG